MWDFAPAHLCNATDTDNNPGTFLQANNSIWYGILSMKSNPFLLEGDGLINGKGN